MAQRGAGGDRAPPGPPANQQGLLDRLCRYPPAAQCVIAWVRLRPPAQPCAAPGASRQMLAEHAPRPLARRDSTSLPRSAGVSARADQVCAATRAPRSQRAEHALAPLAQRDGTFLPLEAKVRPWRPKCVPSKERSYCSRPSAARSTRSHLPPRAAGGPRRAAQVWAVPGVSCSQRAEHGDSSVTGRSHDAKAVPRNGWSAQSGSRVRDAQQELPQRGEHAPGSTLDAEALSSLGCPRAGTGWHEYASVS